MSIGGRVYTKQQLFLFLLLIRFNVRIQSKLL